MKRIKPSQVVKLGKAKADRIRRISAKRYQKIRRNLKKTFSKKKNQRRAIYLILVTLIVGLGVSSGYQQKSAEQERKNLTKQLIHYEQRRQTVTEELRELKKAKTATDAELKQKADSEAELKKQVDELNKQLSVKQENQRLASIAAGKFASISVARSGGVTAGNTYDWGQCTWYAKSRRPDIPNRWGNANQWYASAKLSGFRTGVSPEAGAVGVEFIGRYGHVVYVESVDGDTVSVSEMNAAGVGIKSSRTVSASKFVYIYR